MHCDWRHAFPSPTLLEWSLYSPMPTRIDYGRYDMSSTRSQRSDKRVSSPASTGGAGTLYEQHVDAAFLTLLLIRGIPPVLNKCVVTEVHIQTERLGWQTDDVLIVGTNGQGEKRRLICQVKLSFTVSAADQDCKGTIIDCWTDFRNDASFCASTDQFAVITLRGTNTFLGHFAALLDCARASHDSADFDRRLHTPGFVNAKVTQYYEQIRQIISEHESRDVPIAEVWPLLKVMHALSFDLNTATRQTENQYKTLLAYTNASSDPAGTADATWTELLREAGDGMTHGKSYVREDLPDDLRNRHSPVDISTRPVFRALADHSAIVLNGIRTVVANDVHLSREAAVESLLEKLQTDQIVIVTGPAGSGKSGIIKGAVQLLANEFTFSFRAEFFTSPHLDEALQRNQIPTNAVTLGALLAGQSRKLLVVESVERLLEASTREAFTDLLTLLKSDRSWRLVLSCRDYSAELVRTALLQFAGAEHSVLTVSPLNDEELSSVQTAVPILSRPLSNPRLRALLRNPYFLDKASQMDWPPDRPLPEDEKAFRSKFWSEIIRNDSRPANDMPRRRQDAFVEISRRRAQALTPYVTRVGLDSEAVMALRGDSLISFSSQSDAFVAPAHDVLEDWAIIQWIYEQYALCNQSLEQLQSALGTYPAIRRTYRKWVSEVVENDAATADRMFGIVTGNAGLSPQFRDDTVVSLLHSSSAGELLRRHSDDLFSADRQLLHRVIHLLRVACVTTPPWFEGAGAIASMMHVPDGPVWETVLELVRNNLTAFTPSDFPLLVGFIEDAARGVSWQTPYPPGSDHISAIAYWLLPHFDGYRTEKQRDRLLHVIAKLPKCNTEGFRRLLCGDPEETGHDRISEDLHKTVIWGIESMAVCRDVPDVVIDALREVLILTEEDIQQEWMYSDFSEIEPAFGIKEHTNFDGFPASAFRGPFIQLLRYHPAKALIFLYELFNHSASWYGTGKMRMQFVESPSQITLTFADGTTQTQWCNLRLWNLYRGTSVGPYVLQSALMALEQWLLTLAVNQPDALDKLLCTILRRSENAALTAVVASVAVAHPRLAPEVILVLLSSLECIVLDRARMAHESQAISLSSFAPFVNARDEVYDEERKAANGLSHRRHDLEAAVANVQLTSHRERVQAIIDRYRASMPPVENQTEQDRMRRLVLHRMDLRQYTVASPYQPSAQEEGAKSADGTETKMIRFDLAPAEPDVQEMVDRRVQESAHTDSALGLFMWGYKIFCREEDNATKPSDWRQRLQEARAIQNESSTEGYDGLGDSGAEFVASVCVRDHFNEMATDEVNWCVEQICDAIEREANNWSDLARKQHYVMGGDRPCASVIPRLIGKALDESLVGRVRNALAAAVLHPVDEVRNYAAFGIGQHLWPSDPVMVRHCINVLATEARLVHDEWNKEKKRPYSERPSFGQIECDVGIFMRERFFSDQDDHAFEELDVTQWAGSDANLRILSILLRAPEQEYAIPGFQRLAAVLIDWWDADDERDGCDRREYSTDVRIALMSLLEEFILKVPGDAAENILEPILSAIDRRPKEISYIIQGAVGYEDRLQRPAEFWHIWELFAERIKSAAWLTDIDREHADGAPVLASIFLTEYWKKETRHWRSLEGYAYHVDRLFEALPPSASVLDNYTRFLYHIGEQSLPSAFGTVARRLQAGDARSMLALGNTVFLLESLLRRYVYGRPMVLKAQPELREAVLYLLDVLVESGSSSAYRMRDDFVTPAM